MLSHIKHKNTSEIKKITNSTFIYVKIDLLYDVHSHEVKTPVISHSHMDYWWKFAVESTSGREHLGCTMRNLQTHKLTNGKRLALQMCKSNKVFPK